MTAAHRWRVTALAGVSAGLCVGLIYAAAPVLASTQVYEIVNFAATQCLGSNSSNQSDLSFPNRCADVATQDWVDRADQMLPDPINPFVKVDFTQWENGNGQCLGLAGGSGPQLVVGPCTGLSDHSQFWYMAGYGKHMYNGHTGQCVGTKGSGTSEGTLVIEGTCGTNPTQNWGLTALP
jgi:hypothetical protein